MPFLAVYHTDAGIKKQTNQDALLIKTAKTPKGNVGLFMVCDGMGGLSQGELASATVVRELAKWFEKELPEILLTTNEQQLQEKMKQSLDFYVKQLNQKILTYGNSQGAQLGTTITALLVINTNYYLIHVGDSRAYAINHNVVQLTKDQSLIAREVERGNITEEQASKHPKRNILLQCIGAREEIDVIITHGKLEKDNIYLLCTDGYYHEIKKKELLRLSGLSNEKQMQNTLVDHIEKLKTRNEQDNISAILVRQV